MSLPLGITRFVATGSANRIAKRRVAESFSKAASHYDAVAHLQRRVGDHLFNKLATAGYNTVPEVDCVLDLGCGTGAYLPHLRQQFPGAGLIALDLAFGMLKYASTGRCSKSCVFVGADAERLPLASASVDCIFSNLSAQWCDLGTVLRECIRVLKPAGRLYLSTLGPRTLNELRSAWAAVDGYVHVNRFTPLASVTEALADCGFADCYVTRELITLHYPDLRGLTHELKALGAHNINSGAPRGLTGKKRLRTLLSAYEQRRDQQGMLPATYEALYLSARKASV